MSKKMHPTPELVSDLQKVFAKHNWSGQPIGLVQSEPVFGRPESGGDALDPCPEGKVPQIVSYRLPNGEVVNKTICV